MHSTIGIIIGIIVGVVAGMVAVWVLMQRRVGDDGAQSEARVIKYAQDALKQASEQLLRVSEERFKTHQTQINADMNQKKQDLEATIKTLNLQLGRYEQMVKEFETDRERKFGNLERQLIDTARGTEQLQKTTAHLTAILGNVKLRGQWGERMAEDILKYCGMQEGLQYQKQQVLDSNTLRPDYTFSLPDGHKVVMDVKFPMNRYMEYVNTENEVEKKEKKKQFIDDVKLRIKEIARKDYTPAGEQALDYVLLFIPNEQVYGFINQEYPGVIDECLEKKIILCSPWTLYAILRIIWQAWDNFKFSESIKGIITLINEFKDEFDRFRTSMDKVEKSLDAAHEEFHTLADLRQRKLDKKIEKIQKMDTTVEAAELEAPENNT